MLENARRGDVLFVYVDALQSGMTAYGMTHMGEGPPQSDGDDEDGAMDIAWKFACNPSGTIKRTVTEEWLAKTIRDVSTMKH